RGGGVELVGVVGSEPALEASKVLFQGLVLHEFRQAGLVISTTGRGTGGRTARRLTPLTRHSSPWSRRGSAGPRPRSGGAKRRGRLCRLRRLLPKGRPGGVPYFKWGTSARFQMGHAGPLATPLALLPEDLLHFVHILVVPGPERALNVD